ncbi:hypothetical protein CPB85DRAFT_1435745 [Mucidula mucida]|nr:hypothetical protein CPB85DRAFT_1435745 [Mucidula mucida]
MDGPSATDSILQNSAALHSLKKEQLVRLCKAHGVKANGKKSEMAERLAQLHAANEGSSADGAKENMNPTAEEVGREIITSAASRRKAPAIWLIQMQPPCPSSLSYLPLAFRDPRLLHCLPLPKHQSQATVSSVASGLFQVLPHQIPLPASPLIEPFTPPPNVDVGNTIRLVNIPRFSSSSFEASEPPFISTPPPTSVNWRVGDTPMLAPFQTSFDLVVDGGVDTPARDVARMLRNDPGTPTRSNGAEGRFEFGTPRASGWAFRPSLSLPPPVPPLPERFRDGQFGPGDEYATEDDLEHDSEEQTNAEGQKRKVVPRPSVTLRVMEELMQRAEIPVDPSRPVKPIPRRSLVANASPSSSTPTQQVSDRFEKVHEQLEARMPAINEPTRTVLVKKRKVGQDTTDGDGTRKSARVGGRASGARPRSSGVRPRQSGVRPRTSGVRRQSGVRPRVSGVRPKPTPAKKGLIGYVKGWFGVKPKSEPATTKAEAKEKVVEKKPEPIAARKPSTGKAPIAARKVTPGSMGPPKFIPKKSGTAASGSTAARGSITTANTRGSIGSTTKGSLSSTRGSLPAATRGSINASTRGSITSTTRGSITSTTRGSINSSTRGSVTPTSRGGSIRGSITSTTRGSVNSTTRLAPPPSSTPQSIRTRVAAKPSMVPRKVTPTNPSSRLLQPTKSSLARASGPTATPKAESVAANASTPLPLAPRIFREPLSEATLSPSKIPTASGSRGMSVGNSSIASRSASTRRPRISRTTVVARLAARRQVPATPQASSSGSGSSATAVPKPPASVQPAPTYRKSAAGASGRRSLAVDRDRKVRSSVGGGGVGKNAILGRRSVGAGLAAKRR